MCRYFDFVSKRYFDTVLTNCCMFPCRGDHIITLLRGAGRFGSLDPTPLRDGRYTFSPVGPLGTGLSPARSGKSFPVFTQFFEDDCSSKALPSRHAALQHPNDAVGSYRRRNVAIGSNLSHVDFSKQETIEAALNPVPACLGDWLRVVL